MDKITNKDASTMMRIIDQSGTPKSGLGWLKST